MVKQILCGCILCLGISVQAQEVVIDSAFIDEINRGRQLVDSLKKSQNIPAISIAVGVDGDIVWTEAFGFSDIENQIPATTRTSFRVGSIGKSMTAFGLGLLYDQGKLDWDDEVSKYIPAFKNKKYPVSIRQVAGHQGGIRHYKGFEFLSNKQYESVEESLSIFINDRLQFEPGTEFSYSTYGYVLLGRIIEIAAMKDLLEFMQNEIFTPLDLANTLAEDAGFNESGKAKFYSKSGKREAKEVNMSNKWAGGGYLSTPTDLVKMINSATEVLSAETLYELITPQSLADGTKTGYGMGFRISRVQSNNRILVHHGGRSVSARAFLLVIPEEQIVVALCSNTEAEFGILEVYSIGKSFID